LAQSEDERIAVDNVAKAQDSTAKQSTLSTNMIASVNAVKLLRRKMKFLVDMFENSPEVRSSPDYTRRLNQIVHQLKVLDQTSHKTEAEFEENMYSDVAALNLLSSATKGFAQLQEMLAEFGAVN